MELIPIYGITLTVICFVATVYGVQVLPATEVETLKQIGSKLGKTGWDFSVDPCSRGSGWFTPPAPGENDTESYNAVLCDFFNNTVSHVTHILLKRQNLAGILPIEIISLPFLKEIDLSRNYLNGIIPKEWGKTQLEKISLLGNRISGEIPKELGNISTLISLNLECNQLSGSIPPEFGNLVNIERMLLTSNNLSGELPLELEKLIKMNDLRIGDNNFMRKIPNFIGNWPNLKRLYVQGSGLEGPIPNAISKLTSMTNLRISDINGTESPFPNISNLKMLEILILRSCNLVGPLPLFLVNMANLKTLDLSFNKLSGEIPPTYSSLSNTNYIYLTGNLLNGTVPDWIQKSGNNFVDISFNNFSQNTMPSCQQGRSISLPCLENLKCSDSRHSLHINCGGNEETIKGIKYESDIKSGEAASFNRESNWAFSNTGHFLDAPNEGSSVNYLTKNNSVLPGNISRLSMDARLTPLSLTYYGFCLINGNYSVKLHFAEIMFTNDTIYSSLGRRIFDVYIQGKLELKDFNIENEAGGVGIEIVKPFSANVTNRTLKIQLRWSGKGTMAIPNRGVYGPLISAISVELPGFSYTGRGLSVGAISGIIFSIALVVILILMVLWRKGCIGHKRTLHPGELKGYGLNRMALQTGSFSLKQIKAATNNFDRANKIGEGGFGPVYKGVLPDNTTIAVKQLSSKSNQGNREFVNEIGMISSLQNPYLVKLYGCCIEDNQLLLVYEYMENNSLFRALSGPEKTQIDLDWSTRYRICIGIARGLTYLHEESRIKIVHRDIKTTNVLLDKDLNPKISDFGLAKLDEEDNTHINTRVAGTHGYMAPEYALHGYLTDKVDVYSFGIVALEIVSGKTNNTRRPMEDNLNLLHFAHTLKKNGTLMDIVDSRLGQKFNQDEAMTMINIAFICTKVTYASRPTMSSVVSMLEDRNVPENLLLDLDLSVLTYMEKMIETTRNLKQTDDLTPMSMPASSSSISARDLYPITANSSYLANTQRVMSNDL